MGAAVAHAAFRELYAKAFRVWRPVTVLAVRFKFVLELVTSDARKVLVLGCGDPEESGLILVTAGAVHGRSAGGIRLYLRSVSLMAFVAIICNIRMWFMTAVATRDFSVDVMASGTNNV